MGALVSGADVLENQDEVGQDLARDVGDLDVVVVDELVLVDEVEVGERANQEVVEVELHLDQLHRG